MVAITHEQQAIDPSPLEASGLPTFFKIANFGSLGLPVPRGHDGTTVRVHAHSLSAMQKEAIVYSTATRHAWRLASDEGAYLNGHDAAPCPLAFMTTGMICSIMSEIHALAAKREIEIADIELVQHNRYTMEGSALRGTMTGGALPVELAARIASPADDDALAALVADAVHYSPMNGLVSHRQRSLFTLTSNGTPTPLGRAHPLGAPAAADPVDAFALAEPVSTLDAGLIERLATASGPADVAGGAGSSLKEQQSRVLHLEASCRRNDDGLMLVEQRLLSPIGSTFRFVCEEPDEAGGRGRAPDALSLAAAGIAFCFMTQLGRYSAILRKALDAYRVVQDLRFSPGGGTGGTGHAGSADPVETHVFLETPEDESFARACVDMGEQTCFLHALCRSALGTRISIERTDAATGRADAAAD